jgi:hypothetical protein
MTTARIAPASIIADAAATLLSQIEQSPRLNGEREAYINATIRALGELAGGTKIEPTDDGYRCPSRTRNALDHYVCRDLDRSGRMRYRCDCEAGLSARACWHKAAALICDRIRDSLQSEPPATTPEPAPAPRPTAAERTGVSREQVMRDIAELYN